MSKGRKLFDNQPLSKSLRKAIVIAQESSAVDLVHWLQLELGGYYASNSAMDEDTIVPEYRTVVGQHADIYGRVLVLPQDISFINETRLRNGVEELETLVSSRDMVAIHDPYMCDLIKEHLHVEVYSFRFSTVHLIGILSAVRTELETKLRESNLIGTSQELNSKTKNEDILQLRPNFYGMGIDLRAVWRRWKGPK